MGAGWDSVGRSFCFCGVFCFFFFPPSIIVSCVSCSFHIQSPGEWSPSHWPPGLSPAQASSGQPSVVFEPAGCSFLSPVSPVPDLQSATPSGAQVAGNKECCPGTRPPRMLPAVGLAVLPCLCGHKLGKSHWASGESSTKFIPVLV